MNVVPVAEVSLKRSGALGDVEGCASASCGAFFSVTSTVPEADKREPSEESYALYYGLLSLSLLKYECALFMIAVRTVFRALWSTPFGFLQT